MDLDYPYHIDRVGRTATTDRDNHIRDMIEQVLFTTPGERVMRPDFGSGLLGLVFEPNSVTLAATVQMLVQAALEQHVGHLIAVERVDAENADGALRVTVSFTVLQDQTLKIESFALPGSGP